MKFTHVTVSRSRALDDYSFEPINRPPSTTCVIDPLDTNESTEQGASKLAMSGFAGTSSKDLQVTHEDRPRFLQKVEEDRWLGDLIFLTTDWTRGVLEGVDKELRWSGVTHPDRISLERQSDA